jgi:protein-tyrosine phosphatase
MSCPGFIDIHSHILPGIDDGPQHLFESVEMAKRYFETGATCVIATPHYIPGTGWNATREIINERKKELEIQLEEKGIPIKILTGMEISFDPPLHLESEFNNLLPLGETGYFLVETPLFVLPPDFLDMVLEFKRMAKGIILAHPERSRYFQNNLNMLKNLVDKDIYVQVNSGSILGHYGNRARKSVMSMFKKGYIHFIASDSHNFYHRPPPGMEQWDELRQTIGESAIRSACIDNPSSLLNNKKILNIRAANVSVPKKSVRKKSGFSFFKKISFIHRSVTEV